MKTFREVHLWSPGAGYRLAHSSVAHDTATVPTSARGSWQAVRAAFLPVRPTAKFMASEIPASVSAVIVGGLASFFALLRNTWKSEAPRSRPHLLSQVRPVCHDLREEPVVIPAGALTRTLIRL